MNLISKQFLYLFFGYICLFNTAYAQTYQEGRAAYISGEYQTAYDILRPLADSGDADAQKMMGIMYDYGQGVSADPQQALEWYILIFPRFHGHIVKHSFSIHTASGSDYQ